MAFDPADGRRRTMAFEEKAAPGHTALLVIDIQREYFVAGGVIDRLGYDYRLLNTILAPLEALVVQARRCLPLVVFTRDVRLPALRSAVAREHCARVGLQRPYDASLETFHRLAPAPGDTVITKHRYSAFHGTPLDDILRANAIRTLVLTGVATNVCVESTARAAYMHDYHVVVPRDLTAGVSAAACRASLATIDQFFGEVVDGAALRRCWPHAADARPEPATP